jgi:hypothetical protein
VDAVWNLIMDPRRLHEWVTIHRSLHSASTGSPHVGDEMDQTLALRGAPFRVHWVLSVCDAPVRAEWTGRGPARSRALTEYRLTPLDEGTRTRFDYRNEFHPPLGPLGAAAGRALVGHLPQREADASLARLKSLLE